MRLFQQPRLLRTNPWRILPLNTFPFFNIFRFKSSNTELLRQQLRLQVPSTVTYPCAFNLVMQQKLRKNIEQILFILICERWICSETDLQQVPRLIDNALTKIGFFSQKFYHSTIPILVERFLSANNDNANTSLVVDLLWSTFREEGFKAEKHLLRAMISYYKHQRNTSALLDVISASAKKSNALYQTVMIALQDLSAFKEYLTLWNCLKNSHVNPISPFLYRNILFALMCCQEYDEAQEVISHFMDNKENILSFTSQAEFPIFWEKQITFFYNTMLNFYSQTDNIPKLEEIFIQSQSLNIKIISIYHIMMKRYFTDENYEKVASIWNMAIERGIEIDGEFIRLYILYLIRSGNLDDIPSLLTSLEAQGIKLNEDVFMGIIKGYVKSIQSKETVFKLMSESRVQPSCKILNAILIQLSSLDDPTLVLNFWSDIKKKKYGDIKLDITFYNSLLKICSKRDLSTESTWVHTELQNSGLEWTKETFLWFSKFKYEQKQLKQCSFLWSELGSFDPVPAFPRNVRRYL